MLKIIFWGLLIVGAVAILGAWILMIVAGALHHEVAVPKVPAYSFRESFWLSVGLMVLGSYFRSYGSRT